MEKTFSVLAYGGGLNSSALIVGLHQREIPVDLILFADTGGEQPETYAYLPIMNQWLIDHGMPQITVVEYTDKNGDRLTLEQECLRPGTLRYAARPGLRLQKVFPQAQNRPPGQVLQQLPALPGGMGQRGEGGQVHRLRCRGGAAA